MCMWYKHTCMIAQASKWTIFTHTRHHHGINLFGARRWHVLRGLQSSVCKNNISAGTLWARLCPHVRTCVLMIASVYVAHVQIIDCAPLLCFYFSMQNYQKHLESVVRVYLCRIIIAHLLFLCIEPNTLCNHRIATTTPYIEGHFEPEKHEHYVIQL